MTTTSPSPAARPQRPRVALVFGGRSSEHAVSCATAAGVLRAIDRDAYDVVPDRHRRATATGCSPTDDPQPLELTAGPHARGRRRPAPASSCRWRTHRPRAHRARGRADRRASSARSTSSSRCCTGRSARTAPCRACSSSSDIRYVGSGVLASAAGMDKHYMKVVFAGARPPGRPVRRDHRPRSGSATRRPRWTPCAAPGLPACSSSRPGPGRAWASPGSTTPEDLEAAIEAAREHDPKVVVEAGDRRPRDRVRGAAGPRRRAPRGPRRSARSRSTRGRPRLLRLRGQVPRRGRRRLLSCPADVPDGGRRARCGGCAAAAFEAARLRGAGARRLLLHRDRRRRRQRDQHDAGLHAALDVPADVGGLGPGATPS